VIRRDKSVFLIDRVLVDDVAELQKVVSSRGGDSMETQVLPVDADAASILAAIPTDAQAVYIGALLRLPNDQMQPLIDGLNARRLPTYASQGRPWVELGAFTSTVPADEEQRRMRRIALYIQESTVGGKLESFATTFERRTELVINMTTARKIRVYPRFELMTEAKLIDDDPEDRGEPLSLNQAVDLALAANRDLVATRRDAKIADADVDGALSVFVPQVSVNGEATWIDPDVASPFFNSERALGYSITGSQLIYGAGAIPGVRAQQAARRSVTAAIQSVELDTVQDAATAYLDVLRARTAERINRENLERVRQNLALAEVRVEIGSAGRQEVFRWENEIADSRVDVIAASAIRNQTEIQLNRIINRPLEQNFSTVDPSSGEIGPVVLESVARFIDDPWSFKVFRDFAAEEAKDNSPELKQLREAITSNEQVLSGRRQQLFLPDLLVSGGVSHTPIRGGVGSEEVPGGGGIPQRVDWQWQLAAALSFNVFDYTRYPEIE
ncbi:MAG: TolC family protein, partial [Myxococcota bacterium]